MQKEGFSGLDGRTSIFDWCKVPALEHPDPKVLARYEDILFWSKHPAFAQGKTYDLCYCQGAGFDPDRHFAFARAWGHESFLVIANFGHTQEITVHIPTTYNSLDARLVVRRKVCWFSSAFRASRLTGSIIGSIRFRTVFVSLK